MTFLNDEFMMYKGLYISQLYSLNQGAETSCMCVCSKSVCKYYRTECVYCMYIQYIRISVFV